MPIRHPLFSAFFFLGGILVAIGFLTLFVLGNMESGMSDAGASTPSPSVAPLIICVESFFILGAIASLSLKMSVRRILAAMAHIALLLAVIYLWHIGLPIVNFATKFIMWIAIIYAYSWFAVALPRDKVLPPKQAKDL